MDGGSPVRVRAQMPAEAPTPRFRLALAMRFALREMRGGLSGFYIFLACIALGVAAIGGVLSVGQSLSSAIATEGRSILGGDLRFSLVQRQAKPGELAWLQSLGRVATSVSTRSMVRLPDNSDQSLADVKAVDGSYPLYGRLETTPAVPHERLFGLQDGSYGAAAPQVLLDRLKLKPGDRVMLGRQAFTIRAVLDEEPDSLSDGIGFAPRFLVSLAGLEASGLLQPGSLFQYRYKIALAGETGKARLESIRSQAEKRFPEAGWDIRTRLNAAPALSDNILRFSQFLSLVGLTALVVGGVGVANAVRAHLDGKRAVIATLKCLGASGRFVTRVYLAQILIVALVGMAIGLLVAMAIPYAAGAALSGILPQIAHGGLYPVALAMAALFGLLTTLAFAVLPLGRTREVSPAALFRGMGGGGRGLPRLLDMMVAGAFIGALAALAWATAYDRQIALVFIVAAAAAFLVLRLVAAAIEWLARRSLQISSTPLRLAIGNIHRPGALTPSVVLSLGLGLTLLVTLALIDGNLRREIIGGIPKNAPSFFFVDIQDRQMPDFRALIAEQAPGGNLAAVPMLRGRIIGVNGVEASKVRAPSKVAWVLQGDRGITYADSVPEDASIAGGRWWPKDYSGEPLVSFSKEEAQGLGLKLGDTVTVNVLGRNVTAKIASFRTVKWQSLAINFVMIFSPNTFAGAPHAWLATLTLPDDGPEKDAAIMRAVAQAFPTITAVRVKDAIDLMNRLIGRLGTAMRAAAVLALVSSVLVLGGALAAGNRARIHDAVILKTLGATRRTLIAAYTFEYAMLALATAVFAIAAGGVASWYVVTRIMGLTNAFLPQPAVMTAAVALVVTVGAGLAGTWRILGQKAAPVLRDL